MPEKLESLNRTFFTWNKFYPCILGIILFLTIGIRFVEPVKDGDLFWHLKYAEYMLENKTLVPDHSIYSWTPATNAEVYCTWIGDFFLYLFYGAGGLPLLFAFRYFCVFLLTAIIWIYARRLNQGRSAFTFLILIIAFLDFSGGAILKPEILSFIYFPFAFALYFFVKTSQWYRWQSSIFLLYPVLFLVWANTHMIFFFGLIWLASITFGELLNYCLKTRSRLSGQGMRHLLSGALLSVAVTFVNPYGYKLHLQFLDLLTTRNIGEHSKVISYESIFSGGFSSSYLAELWAIMLILFGVFFVYNIWKKRECDWAILLSTIFLASVSAKYARSSFYWPVFWGMSIIYLRSRVEQYGPRWTRTPALSAGITLLFLFLSARTIYYARCKPIDNLWPGFGIGYTNPVQASAFLKEHRPGTLLYNSYDSGGYLLFDLYPDYKVFIDPRYFPYKKWFTESRDFHAGSRSLDSFQKEYPFDVAVMEYYSSRKAIGKFILSKEWNPVYYGPDGIVFVKKGIDFDFDFHTLDAHRFDTLNSLEQARKVFMVALDLDDMETSANILQLIKTRFSHMSSYEKTIERLSKYQEGLKAMHDGNYDIALETLEHVGIGRYTVRTNQALSYLWKRKSEQCIRNKEYKKAFDLLENLLRYFPDNADALFNTGLVSHIMAASNKSGVWQPSGEEEFADKKTEDWKRYLEHFLEVAPDHPRSQVARQMLDGKGLLSGNPKTAVDPGK